MRLVAERGWAGVSIRDIASAAGVSSSLVVHHYGTKSRLREAADRRAVDIFTSLIEGIGDLDDLGELTGPSVAAAFVQQVGDTSPVLGYTRRLLIDGGEAAATLFDSLFSATQRMVGLLEARGLVRPADDGPGRAAFLLVADLAVLILRDQLGRVLGVDPLGRTGMTRWGRTVMDIYGQGLFAAPDVAETREVRHGATAD